MKVILILLLCITGTICFGQTDSLFYDKAETMKVYFQQPENYIEAGICKNNIMSYEKAYLHPDIDFEVRYALRQHSAENFRTPFELTCENVSGSVPEYNIFKPDAANREFNADVGATVIVIPKTEFAGTYKYCQIIQVFKKGTGEIYMFYLANDRETLNKGMESCFYSIKFKN